MSRPPLVLVRQHFGALVFDRRTSRYSPWDHACAAALARLCTSPPSAVFSTARDDDEREALVGLVQHLAREGWLREDGRLDAAVIDRTPPATHLLGPLSVHLEVVGACNLTCTHCFASPLPRNHDPLRLDELDRLFAELASLGSFRLGLTGGEPTLRRDLIDLVDAATGHGLHPCLTTNALRIDEALARALGQRDLVWLNVSLEGPTREENDAVRGAGVFDAVLEKLALLRRHARFTLAFTLTAKNAHRVIACAELARAVGAHTAVFRPLYPVGSALDHASLVPTYAQYREALEALARFSLDGADHDACALDPFSPASREDLRGSIFEGHGCGAGNTVCSISVQGAVNGCSFLGSAFDDGTIRERSFEELWNQGQRLRSLRSDPSDGFRGGCRARAQYFEGSAYGEDPWQRAHEGREGRAQRRHLAIYGVHA